MKRTIFGVLIALITFMSCSATDEVLLSESPQASGLISGAVYKITPYLDPNKSISVDQASLSEGASIVAWEETGVNAQRWRLNKDESGQYYYLTNVYTGQSLHIQNPVSLGANIRQYEKEDSYNYKWLISESGEGNVYYISPALLASENQLYLEVGVDGETLADGTELKSYIKREGEGQEIQKWKLERVSEVPNRFTATMRDEIVRAWKNQYYKKAQNTGYTLSNAARLADDSHVWQDSEMFEILLDAYETTYDNTYKEMFHQLYINFVAENGKNWLYNQFNDDITWMIIACVRANLLFGDKEYLAVAVENFTQMYDRALMPEGSLRWCEKPEERLKTNSCINSPAVVAACYLAQATGDESYYEKAKGVYEKQSLFLYESTSGMVYDCVTTDNFSPWKWASTYNQGTFIGASIMLYNHFHDDFYKENALKTVEYTVKHFSDKNGIMYTVDENSDRDRPGFKGILMRYMRQFVTNFDNTAYIDWMEANALQAYNNKNTKGIIWTDWTVKSSENFIYKGSSRDENYATDPWGTSTAMAIAVNLPLIQK